MMMWYVEMNEWKRDDERRELKEGMSESKGLIV